MKKLLPTVLMLAMAGAACSSASNDSSGPSTDRTGGSGGSSSRTGGSSGTRAGGSGGSESTAGSGGSASAGSGGSTSTAGSSGSPSDAATASDSSTESDAPVSTDDAAVSTPADGSVSSGDGGGGPLPEGMLGWYEAEAADNTFFGAAKPVMCGTAPACTSISAIKEGIECCSAGKKVSQLLRGKGGVVFNKINAPSDGMYDVTWWYHCGKSDNFGDSTCGGVPHTSSGCRPHILEVNGTKNPKVFEFPCFPGTWGEIHVATTTGIAMKAGDNSIKVYATPGRDAADLDAIAVYPVGKGTMPVAGSH